MTRNGVSAASAPHPIRWEFVAESLDEATFLWRHRERALSAADRDVHDVARSIEERLLGCFDGLHVGGTVAVDHLLVPALRATEAARVSVAAHALAANGSQHAWAALLVEFAEASDERAEAMARGLELVERADLIPLLEDFAESSSLATLASLVELRAYRRLDAGPRAREFIASGHPRLQRAAVQAARHGAGAFAESVIELGLEQSCLVRDAAVESGLILGSGAAASCCSEVLDRLPDDCGHLLLMAALARPEEERRSLLTALGHERLAAAAVWALGFAGTRWAADACVELMRQGRHTILAREAFRSITGMGAEPGCYEEDAMSSAEVNTIERWWTSRRGGHDPAVRHIQGRPIDRTVLAQTLLTHAMRRRHGVALELAVLSKAERQLNTRAWCWQQRREASGWVHADLLARRIGSNHVGSR